MTEAFGNPLQGAAEEAKRQWDEETAKLSEGVTRMTEKKHTLRRVYLYVTYRCTPGFAVANPHQGVLSRPCRYDL